MAEKIQGFIIDSSALKNIFEGKNEGKSDDLLRKLKDIKDKGGKITAVTTLSAFLRAIFLCDPKVNINKIQKTLSFLQVAPSFADFKDKKAVMEEILKFADIMSRGGRKSGK